MIIELYHLLMGTNLPFWKQLAFARLPIDELQVFED
jgi:hypothetical protein